MRKNIIYALILLLLPLNIISAQKSPDAEQILTNLLNTAKSGAIRTNFKLATNDPKNPQFATGIFTLKGARFTLEMDGMRVWFDGRTQWAYNEQNNEVSVTNPTEKELSETNPMAILSGFKSKCTINFSTKVKSSQNYCIEMIPKVKSKDIVKIEVQLNKTNENLVSIKLTDKNGISTILTLNNFQKGIKVLDNIFVFNETKFKGVTVNDLRYLPFR